MSHDRTEFHSGTETDRVVLLATAIDTFPVGTDVHTVLAAIDARLALLERQDTPVSILILAAIRRRLVSSSFTLNAMRRVIRTGSFTLDAEIRKTVTATFTLDAVKKRTTTTTFTLDAVIASGGSDDFQGDAFQGDTFQ